jgi:membrane protease YdiL (CAAX protease family)
VGRPLEARQLKQRSRFASGLLKRLLTGLAGLATVLGAIIAVGTLLNKRVSPDIIGPALAVAALCAYVAYVRLLERRTVTELAPRAALPGIASGIVLGAVLYATTMLVLWLLRDYRFDGFASWAPLGAGILAAISTAFIEEIIMRGLVYRVVESVAGTWIALALSAALFGALHGANRGATPFSSLAIALEAGVLLAAAYAATGRLWLPIGLHAGWNFTEGTIFGGAVSGAKAAGVTKGVLSGPALLSGGAFGAEASVAAVVVCLVAAIFLLRLASHRGRIAPPAWVGATLHQKAAAT